MSRKAIIIWSIIIVIAIISIIITYLLLNNGSSSNNASNSDNNNPSIITPISEQNIENIDKNEGSGDYYYWSIMPLNLQSKLPSPRTSSLIDYYYSKDLGIAFSYETQSIVDKNKFITLTTSENEGDKNVIYLHNFNEAKESGQSIEIININLNYRFNTITEIISLQLLDDKQKELCKIEQKNNRYSIIAKDTKVKDSTTICGKYARGNNRFFIKPRQEGSTISKLVFVNAGSKELSYNGTMQGNYWYDSIIVE